MKKSTIALIIGILCISIFPIIIKLNFAPSVVSAFYRIALALLLLFPFTLLTNNFKPIAFKYIVLSMVAGVFAAGDIAVWNIAIEGSSTTQASLLTNLAPIWVGIISFIFFKKPSLNFWIGSFVALLGMVIFIGYEVLFSLSIDIYFMLGVLSGILYSIYISMSKNIIDNTPLFTYMVYNLLGGTLVLGAFCIYQNYNMIDYPAITWGAFFVQATVCQLSAWLLIGFATKFMNATTVSLSFLSQVIITAFLAWILIDEKITFQMVIGGIVILVGLGVTFIQPKNKALN